jgi:pyridinium-3,5-biscarboxylic acid mononucleotide sulfurtransferase
MADTRIQDIEKQAEQLVARIRAYPSCAVAFSAGVDSTVVARAAREALGDQAVAVTGVSPSLPAGELEAARQLAAEIGIRHKVLETTEFQQAAYVRNAPDRCYHCKSELYQRMDDWLPRLGVEVILNGANADDLHDYRPGLQAAAEHAVRSPLAELGYTKQDVRRLAEHWQLPVWDKPASPCLSSRVAYGESVTPERLARIDQAEQYLRREGFRIVRVRFHTGELARIEAPVEDIPRLCEPTLRQAICRYFQQLGFRFVTIDAAGFRSGSLNELVPLDTRLAAGKH